MRQRNSAHVDFVLPLVSVVYPVLGSELAELRRIGAFITASSRLWGFKRRNRCFVCSAKIFIPTQSKGDLCLAVLHQLSLISRT